MFFDEVLGGETHRAIGEDVSGLNSREKNTKFKCWQHRHPGELDGMEVGR